MSIDVGDLDTNYPAIVDLPPLHATTGPMTDNGDLHGDSSGATPTPPLPPLATWYSELYSALHRLLPKSRYRYWDRLQLF